LNTLLGDKPVFEPTKRVYQRLLAGDDEEAAELLDEYFEHAPLVDVYDTVLIPALVSAETHWRRGELEESRHKFILQTLKSMIQERGERERELQEKESNENMNEAEADSSTADRAGLPGLCVLCMPAHGKADELAGMMLAQIVHIRGCFVETVSATAMAAASELVDYVEQRKADVVCISAAPPAAVAHARRLCMRLRRRFPELNLVVGLWNSPGDLNEAKERIDLTQERKLSRRWRTAKNRSEGWWNRSPRSGRSQMAKSWSWRRRAIDSTHPIALLFACRAGVFIHTLRAPTVKRLRRRPLRFPPEASSQAPGHGGRIVGDAGTR
jgi:hypothetical protein